MSGDTHGIPVPRAVDAVLREFVNALGKVAIYPPGHRFISESAASLIDRLDVAMADRDSLTISILPHGLLLDGMAADPLPGVLREFAARMHRKNIAVIQLRRGVTAAELAAVLGALAASDADETVGRDGLHLEHARVEPMTYDALALGGTTAEHELDEAFWTTLAEAAFDRQMAGSDTAPTVPQLADAISERAARGADGAKQVYEALATFAAALAGREGHVAGGARHRFVELLSALSRPTTTRVVSAAPSSASRRRFLTDALELVPPALLIQLLESVAEADDKPISAPLRSLLGKLAGGEGIDVGAADGGFAMQVLGLVQQWDGVSDEVDEAADAHVGVDPARVLALGLEVGVSSAGVIGAACRLADAQRLVEALQLIDDSRNDSGTAHTVRDAILGPALIEKLLAEPATDFALVERVAAHIGSAALGHLLDALAAATERTARRRLLDILVRVGPGAEATLLARLEGAPWYLARNILAVLAQFPAIANVEPVFTALSDPEVRVRQEALKVLVRQRPARDRAIAQALVSGEESLVRMALTALGGDCPPQLVAAVLAVLDHPEPALPVQAIRALAESDSPLIVARLLPLVRARRGVFRRVRLRPKSPVMLAALELLARRWRTEGPVVAVMQLVAASTDPEVRGAIGAAG